MNTSSPANPVSAPSARARVRWRGLFAGVLGLCLPVLAQGGATAERLQHTGAEHVSLPAAPDPESVAEALALILKGPATP